MADPDPTTVEADFQRELTARRKDLAREFDDKQRELRAQHQRRMDALRQEQSDWEETRRSRTKELADREEKLRRGEERLHKDTHRTVTARDEAAALRNQLQGLEQATGEAAIGQADLKRRTTAAEMHLRFAQRRIALLAALIFLAPLAWIVAEWPTASGRTVLIASLTWGLALALLFWRPRPTN
ncbi:MAG: hypothetical protein WC876_07925 [Candidatus Thermoplasmatota archaeon]|jgi:hypothetical protein